jgi:hypothetical protein
MINIANYGDHTVPVVDTITESVTTVAVSDHPELLAVSPMAEAVCRRLLVSCRNGDLGPLGPRSACGELSHSRTT